MDQLLDIKQKSRMLKLQLISVCYGEKFHSLIARYHVQQNNGKKFGNLGHGIPKHLLENSHLQK